ncbi:hypothetical protein U1701_11565 [Sphingomonas sp. PB2P19]|uniref:hypothetical protein n=1 Tax=Sphingomonas rhamnosi TaxID=3096156 RepID=UPI002FCAFD93
MLMIAALLAAAAGTPAVAGDSPAASVTALAPASAGSSPRYVVRYDAKHDRYCVRERGAGPITGSRLVPERCQSRADWAADGLTIARK